MAEEELVAVQVPAVEPVAGDPWEGVEPAGELTHGGRTLAGSATAIHSFHDQDRTGLEGVLKNGP